MPSVHLRFSAPAREDLTKLHIFEAASPAGPFITPIETVNLVTEGIVFPDYISEYTTDQAANTTDWFAIQWEDEGGAKTEISNAMQGGTTTLVGEIIDLVNERDHTLDEQTVRQESEFAIESFFGKDPYTVDSETTTYRIRIGLARVVQARAMLNRLAATSSSGSGSGWTAGLVSMKSSTDSQGASESLIRWLLQEAGNLLGWNYARVAQMATMTIAGGMSAYEIAFPEPILIAVD